MQDNPDFNARAHQRAANEERERKQRAELEEKRLAELGKYSSERAAREWSTVVDISIPPPSFKLVSLSSPRSPLSKTPKQVIFLTLSTFCHFYDTITLLSILLFLLFSFNVKFLGNTIAPAGQGVGGPNAAGHGVGGHGAAGLPAETVIPNLAAYINISDNLVLFQHSPSLKRVVPVAVSFLKKCVFFFRVFISKC